MNRREFIRSAGAILALSGCRKCGIFANPNIRFGVISDIHITTPKSCRMFVRALREFRERRVDAVVIPGDLTDWGLKSGLVFVRRAWDCVFAGSGVVPLFCTGNHDYEGWRYGDMAEEMRANGYLEDDNLEVAGLKDFWQKTFDEPFADIRCRSVKGYDFISCEYGARDGKELREWLAMHGKRLVGTKPFFYFQHLPIRGTTNDSFGWADEGVTKPILDSFPNCIAFTGHAHRPFIDERQIWQGGFTAIGTPSLSYAGFPDGYENGEGDRTGKAKQAMPVIPARRDLRGGQGFVVSVWTDRVVVERCDIEEGVEGAPPWVIPIEDYSRRPYAVGVREDNEPLPVFPAGAHVELETRNTENRTGCWTIALNCEFPSACMPTGHRVFDYELKVLSKDNKELLRKLFLSPAYHRMACYEPASQRFWFDTKEIPAGVEFRIVVRARNCFGKTSSSIVSELCASKVFRR